MGGLEGTPPRRVVVVEGELELQQVVKFNMHVMCHVIFSASRVRLRKNCEVMRSRDHSYQYIATFNNIQCCFFSL